MCGTLFSYEQTSSSGAGRKYCSEACKKEGFKLAHDNYSERKKKGEKLVNKCVVCGSGLQSVSGRGRPKIYCSRKCRNEHYRPINREYMRERLKDEGYAEKHRKSAKLATKVYYEKNAVVICARHKMYRTQNGYKEEARGEVRKAIKNGLLVRNPCQRCGMSHAQAHHEDYLKPLEVVWLCKKHHSQRHAQMEKEMTIRNYKGISYGEERYVYGCPKCKQPCDEFIKMPNYWKYFHHKKKLICRSAKSPMRLMTGKTNPELIEENIKRMEKGMELTIPLRVLGEQFKIKALKRKAGEKI